MMDAEAVLAVLTLLEGEGLPAWIDGGWGIDALAGFQTRPHDDLDLVVPDADRPRLAAALERLGYAAFYDAEPGLPARFVLRTPEGRQIDLHLVRFDRSGTGWQALDGGAWCIYPPEGLTGVGIVAGRRVRCATPQLQLRHHLGYPPTEHDLHDLRLLREHFGIGLPPGI